MVFNYLYIFIPILSLLINVLTQIFSCRYISKLNLLRSVYLGFASGLVTLGIYESYDLYSANSPGNYTAGFVTNLIIYLALAYCYFHFINLGETARRIRILCELYDSKEGLSMTEILTRYNAEKIFEKRIMRLVDTRQIIFKEGRYYMGSPLMLSIAKIILLMKLIIIGKRSEFDGPVF